MARIAGVDLPQFLDGRDDVPGEVEPAGPDEGHLELVGLFELALILVPHLLAHLNRQ